MKAFQYFKSTSLKEALELLITHEKEAALLNGGTDLIVRMREGHSTPKVIIDIKKIPELGKIHVSEEFISIGGCVLLNELGNDPLILSEYPYLAQAALSVGSKQVRNRATCIGNICNASPLADTATPLLALEAMVDIYGEEGLKQVPLKDFFVFVRKTVLKETDIVKSITFKRQREAKAIFSKMSRRKEVDLSTVCATVLKGESGFKIAFGAVAPTPMRLYETEKFLGENPLSESVIEQACACALSEIKPISDIRASDAYRKEMVMVMLRRSLSEWL